MKFKKVFPAVFLLFGTVVAPDIVRAGEARNGAQAHGPLVKLSVIYDNTTYNRRLREDWGLAVLVEIYGKRILFDSGLNPEILQHNMKVLGISPQSFQEIVISHQHPDHVNGLKGLLPLMNRPTVYVPGSFSSQTKANLAQQSQVMEVKGTAALMPGVWLVDVPVPPGIAQRMGVATEQALVVSIDDGLLVLAGCSHPTSDGIVRHVSSVLNRPVKVLVGGLHIKDKNEARRVTRELKRLGVREVMPLHCSGKDAESALRGTFAKKYLPGGAGRILEIPLLAPSEMGQRKKAA